MSNNNSNGHRFLHRHPPLSMISFLPTITPYNTSIRNNMGITSISSFSPDTFPSLICNPWMLNSEYLMNSSTYTAKSSLVPPLCFKEMFFNSPNHLHLADQPHPSTHSMMAQLESLSRAVPLTYLHTEPLTAIADDTLVISCISLYPHDLDFDTFSVCYGG